MKIKHPNFISNNRVFCVRCQICGKENYALAVANGICAWCGEDHNKLREESIKPYILKCTHCNREFSSLDKSKNEICDCNYGTLKIR